MFRELHFLLYRNFSICYSQQEFSVRVDTSLTKVSDTVIRRSY